MLLLSRKCSCLYLQTEPRALGQRKENVFAKLGDITFHLALDVCFSWLTVDLACVLSSVCSFVPLMRTLSAAGGHDGLDLGGTVWP